MNVDSAEYANIVLGFTRFYNQARAAGMPPLTAPHKALLGQWIERAVAGYWTHGGYMNWDSGLGFKRWHQAKKLGLTQQALIGIAPSPTLLRDAQWGAWAKYMLDRGFAFYDRTALRDGGLADPVFFDVHKVSQVASDARLAAARMAANAARAIDAGLGRAAASPPARAVRLRPRHRPAGGHDARVQHRDRRRQPARVPVRRRRPRAAVRRRAGGRGQHRRRPAGVVRRARA